MRPTAISLRFTRALIPGFLFLSFFTACKGDDNPIPADGMMPAGTKAYNYTPWYIHTFQIQGPEGSGVRGGGPNVFPAESGNTPSGGGKETCCTIVPYAWQPDLKLTVRWIVDKKRDGKTDGYWYKAENVRLAKYDGKNMGDVWAIFLPDDRIRIMVADDNTYGNNDVKRQPADNDPYVIRGTIDHEWNRLYRQGGDK